MTTKKKGTVEEPKKVSKPKAATQKQINQTLIEGHIELLALAVSIGEDMHNHVDDINRRMSAMATSLFVLIFMLVALNMFFLYIYTQSV